eukprot:gene11542-13474_t
MYIGVYAAVALQHPHSKEYDYVVLGAGTAGSIVASKLSEAENGRYTVLLVEQGGYAQHPWIWDTSSEWQNHWIIAPEPVVSKIFTTTPQEHAFNRTLALNRGQVTGGCSAINSMVYNLGSDYEYNTWAQLTDEKSWRWENVKKDLVPEILAKESIRSLANENRLMADKVIEAVESLGYQLNTDPMTSGRLSGYYPQMYTMKYHNASVGWRRETTYTQFTQPTIDKYENLDVMVYSQATKIEFSSRGNSKVAKGVHVRDVGTGRQSFIKARRQLVVSLGAFDSLILLQQSGVGDTVKLESLGVKPVIHSPGVGYNLFDHLTFSMYGLPVVSKYSKLQPSDFHLSVPFDGLVVSGPLDSTTIKWVLGATINVYRGVVRFVCKISLTAPTSHGSIFINSTSPLDRPYVSPNYLSSHQDVDFLLDAIKECRSIQAALVQSNILNSTLDELNPGKKVTSTEDLETFIRQNIESTGHAHGTCRMGKKDTSPLTGKLLLKGSKNVRVVDASSIPVAPFGLQIPVSMLAIQASKFILQDNK